MNLTPTIYSQYVKNSGAYRDWCSLKSSAGPWDAINVEKSIFEKDCPDTRWTDSFMNPARRIDCLEPILSPRWRIDGADDCGRRLLIVPIGSCGPHPPLRIDLFLPDLSHLPSFLHWCLDISSCTHIRDDRFAQLGLARHALHALHMWTSQHDDFDAYYRSLSPASEIHIENIDINIREMRFSIKGSRVERSLATVERLKASYKHLGYSVVLPPIVSMDNLRVVRQINDTVSLVELPVGYEPRLVIMKSATGTADSLYHEIQILLSLDRHPNLCGRPMGLIVYQSCPTMEPLVFGFLLQFYSGGSLARALCPHGHFKPIEWQEKVKWAKQLAKTLFDLRLKQGIIYGDLKAENVVLSSSIPNSRDLVLIDFEQRGTADAWTPPEIIMMQRLYSMVITCEDPVVQTKSAQLLSLALEEPIPNPVQHYQRMKGRSRNFWYRLRSLEQEAAMVFMLGKLLYCIFENVGTVTHLIVPSHPGESNPQFPRFVISPPKIQQLVMKCTRGAREYETSSPFILRVGNKLVSRGMSGVEGEPMGSPADTIRAARHYWINSLDSSEQFVMARERYRQGKATADDLDLLAYLQRPCFEELLRALDGID